MLLRVFVTWSTWQFHIRFRRYLYLKRLKMLLRVFVTWSTWQFHIRCIFRTAPKYFTSSEELTEICLQLLIISRVWYWRSNLDCRKMQIPFLGINWYYFLYFLMEIFTSLCDFYFKFSQVLDLYSLAVCNTNYGLRGVEHENVICVK